MKLRPVQLVCLALVLSTLSLADSSALVPGQYGMQAGYLRALFLKDYAETWNGTEQQRKTKPTRSLYLAGRRAGGAGERASRGLSAACCAAIGTAWTMRPPSAQNAALQTFTGFGRVSA
jgi:hypothetical protein